MATRTPSWVGGLAVVVIAIAVFGIIARGGSSSDSRPRAAARPARPPGPGDPKPAGLPLPAMPALTPEWKAQLAEQVRGHDRPGEAAFRAVSERYVDENLDLARGQATAEGLTLPEVRELTYFGLMVLATQRVDEVEQITGRTLTDPDRDALAGLMQSSNAAFRESMRSLVARHGGEDERWKLIRSTEARYQTELFRITGLDAGLFDDLLAGDLLLPGAPGRGEPPTGAPVGGPRDVPTTPPRPTQP